MSLTLLLPAVSYAHVAVLAQLARGPLTALEWGVALTGGSFALLLVWLAASFFLRDVTTGR